MRMIMIYNVPDEVVKSVRMGTWCGSSIAGKIIANGISIPDNATNGDVIKVMFPNIITDEFASTIHATTKVVSNGVKGVISYDFWKDWWNSLYQKGE